MVNHPFFVRDRDLYATVRINPGRGLEPLVFEVYRAYETGELWQQQLVDQRGWQRRPFTRADKFVLDNCARYQDEINDARRTEEFSRPPTPSHKIEITSSVVEMMHSHEPPLRTSTPREQEEEEEDDGDGGDGTHSSDMEEDDDGDSGREVDCPCGENCYSVCPTCGNDRCEYCEEEACEWCQREVFCRQCVKMVCLDGYGNTPVSVCYGCHEKLLAHVPNQYDLRLSNDNQETQTLENVPQYVM